MGGRELNFQESSFYHAASLQADTWNHSRSLLIPCMWTIVEPRSPIWFHHERVGSGWLDTVPRLSFVTVSFLLSLQQAVEVLFLRGRTYHPVQVGGHLPPVPTTKSITLIERSVSVCHQESQVVVKNKKRGRYGLTFWGFEKKLR